VVAQFGRNTNVVTYVSPYANHTNFNIIEIMPSEAQKRSVAKA
jgi:hypothetical protein